MDTTLNVEPNEADPDVKVTDEQPKLAANAVERVFLQNTLARKHNGVSILTPRLAAS